MRHQAPDEAILSVRTMETTMAKPTRYPKKLRKTLEKMEANRDARAATGYPYA